MPDWIKNGFVRLLNPVVNGLVRGGVHPNLISTIGFLITVVAAIIIFARHIFIGIPVFLLGGMLDKRAEGIASEIEEAKALQEDARESGLASKFGSFYDSTLDRISEIVVYFSLYAYFRPLPNFWWVGYVVILAMVGSLMVSYTRAKAEALGVECKVGLMQRPERVVLLGVGGLLMPIIQRIDPSIQYAPLLFAIALIAVLANITAVERIRSVYRVAHGVPLETAIPKPAEPEEG